MENEMDRTCSMGGMRNVYKILVGKSEGRRQLRIPGHRGKGNIRVVVREIGQ
jgi:hypothetical protein